MNVLFFLFKFILFAVSWKRELACQIKLAIFLGISVVHLKKIKIIILFARAQLKLTTSRQKQKTETHFSPIKYNSNLPNKHKLEPRIQFKILLLLNRVRRSLSAVVLWIDFSLSKFSLWNKSSPQFCWFSIITSLIK
jgi:hypothetical protein